MTPYYADDLVTIYHGDAAEFTGEAGLIVTDPPYPAEFADCWSILGQLAAATLSPGGWCFAYSGQYNLPDVLRRMENEALAYRWTLALLHGGSGGVHPVAELDVLTDWKPILAFRRLPIPKERVQFHDVIESRGRAKTFHPWQQHESGAAALIARYGPANAVVLDPFCGSGTTLVAAKVLNHHAIGVEISERYCEIAARRCSQEVLGLVG